MESAKLPALGYTSALEALAEKFHASPALLQTLNPGAAWSAGDAIKVPDVEPFELHAASNGWRTSATSLARSSCSGDVEAGPRRSRSKC